MNLIVKIDSIDRTSDVLWSGFSISDNIENKVNTCNFTLKYGAQVPEAGQVIEVFDGETKIFSGEILTIDREIDGKLKEVFRIQSVDYTHNLGRSLVVERYENETVNDIIAAILNKYHVDFSDEFVDCNIEIDTISFNNISASDAIQKMAEATNYRWYVDYDKKVHFYAKGDEVSPFGLTDNNGKYIFKSLKITDDISQLRNSIKIRGGEMVGDGRTEKFDGDGVKLQWALANKFSELPTVTVGGVAKDVGVDNLSAEADHDCFWNFNEKYIRFKVAPASGTNNIVITGTPLIPIIVRKLASASITNYGLREFYVRDNTIKSKEEAVLYANAQLEGYENSIIEGSFETYESGLKSGQVINIQSNIREIDEDFVIQNVVLRMRSPFDGSYKIQLATMRTIGIVDFLQKLLLAERKIVINEQENEPLLQFFEFIDSFSMDDLIGAPTQTEPPYMWMPIDSGDDAAVIAANPTKTPMRWNFFTWGA